MKEGYKDTPIGRIPEDWEIKKLDHLASKVGSGITPRGGQESYFKSGIIFIRSQNVLVGKLNLSDVAYISMEQHDRMNGSKLQVGDVLLNITGASIGRSCVVPSNITEGNVNQHVCIIRTDESLNSVFLCQLLNSLYGQNQIEKFQAGGNREGLNFQQIRSFEIPLPKYEEQSKIASILSTVDDKIDAINERITKTQQLKNGLMQRLLTKGIGHTKFKDSPLGEIPESWEVVKLSEVTINYDSQRIPLKSEDRADVQGSYPYYGAQGIIDYIDKFIFDGVFLLVAEDGENVKSRKNDIAFIAKGKFWLNNHAHILQANPRSEITFLKFMLNFISIIEFVTGQAQPKLNKSALDAIKISLPSVKEQHEISNILSTIDEKLDVLLEKKTEYEKLKKGLMQQLLTGQIRVDCIKN